MNFITLHSASATVILGVGLSLYEFASNRMWRFRALGCLPLAVAEVTFVRFVQAWGKKHKARKPPLERGLGARGES